MERIRLRLTGRSSDSQGHSRDPTPWQMHQKRGLEGRLFVAASPDEKIDRQTVEHAMKQKRCVDEGVAAGSRAAIWVGGITAIPTLVICNTVPWFKANLNYTAQALIISAASIATYFIITEQTILKCTRETSRAALEEKRANGS